MSKGSVESRDTLKRVIFKSPWAEEEEEAQRYLPSHARGQDSWFLRIPKRWDAIVPPSALLLESQPQRMG